MSVYVSVILLHVSSVEESLVCVVKTAALKFDLFHA